MSEPLRVCLYDPSRNVSETVRECLLKVQNVLVLGDAANWEELKQEVRHGAADVVVALLDSNGSLDLEFVHRFTHFAPSCSIIGISAQIDPANIIAAMRAGCSQFVCAPVDAEDLRQALLRIQATRMVNTKGARGARRICVIGSSGGVGTTTVACNLAMELANLSNRRCALVDLNLELGDVGGVFDSRSKFSVADVCAEGVDIDCTVLTQALHELPGKVSLLTRPEKLEDAELATPGGVQGLLGTLAEMFPYVVVDLPRSFTPCTVAALRGACLVLIVSQLGVSSIRNAMRVYKELTRLNFDDDGIQIVLNRCNSTFERITADNVVDHFGKPVYAMIPNDYHRVQTSHDVGHPIVADAPDAPVRLAIQELARKIAPSEIAREKAVASSSGLLSKLLGRSRKTTSAS
jgi:pilus assembly protein CpaE